jgi:hypothetical protein
VENKTFGVARRIPDYGGDPNKGYHRVLWQQRKGNATATNASTCVIIALSGKAKGYLGAENCFVRSIKTVLAELSLRRLSDVFHPSELQLWNKG